MDARASGNTLLNTEWKVLEEVKEVMVAVSLLAYSNRPERRVDQRLLTEDTILEEECRCIMLD